MKKAFWILIVLISCAPKSGPHKEVDVVREAGGGISFETVKAVFGKRCAGCHPSRSGPDFLDYAQAKAYVDNGRLVQRVNVEKSMPPPMSAEAAAIDERERNLIQQWARLGGPEFASRTAKRTPEGPPVDPVLQSCFQCHGQGGPGSAADPKIPRLAGQNEEYLVLQLRRFKWRERIDPTQRMNEAVVGLSEAKLKELARYFASRSPYKPKEVPMEIRESYEIGARLARQACNSCHMNPFYGGRPANPLVPMLTGQSKQYLMTQLLYFRNRERLSPIMHEMTRELSPEDIFNLAVYYAYEASR